MYFSSKENILSASSAKKQVRFNSSGISSPSDAQAPRPLSEIQNVRKLGLFSSQNDDETVKKPFINDSVYLPPRLCDFNSKNSDLNGVSVPKPSSDLELSVFESSSFVDNNGDGRPKCIKDITLDKKLLENDTPYSFSPSKMPLSNPLRPRPGFMDIPRGLATSAANSKKEFQNEKTNDDSIFDFFTKPNSENFGNISQRKTETDKPVTAFKNDVPKVKFNRHDNVGNLATQNKQIQKYENGTRNRRTEICNFERSDRCHVGNECYSSYSTPHCCGDATKRVCRKRETDCHEDVCCQKSRSCNTNLYDCCRSNDDDVNSSRRKIDAVEEKRKAIERKYCKDDDNKVIIKKKRDDEPTVSDLYKIIQMQNQQLLLLQERFDKFLTTKERETIECSSDRQFITNDANFPANRRQTADRHYEMNDRVEHISIGVMTSFEMIMSSNYVNKRNGNVYLEGDKNFIDEGVQTSVRNEANELVETRTKSSPPKLISQVLNNRDDERVPVERNFLDGISRVNNMPSPKRFENKVLDKIDEENHTHNDLFNSPMIRHDNSKQHDEMAEESNGHRQNEGWTFYNNVVNRVNNLLNSPPNNDKDKQPSPPSRSRQHAAAAERIVQRPVGALDRSPVDAVQRAVTRAPPQPVIIGLDKPLSELSLHMRQLASKYNIHAPLKMPPVAGQPAMHKRVRDAVNEARDAENCTPGVINNVAQYNVHGIRDDGNGYGQQFVVDRMKYDTAIRQTNNNDFRNVFVDNARPILTQNRFIDDGDRFPYGQHIHDGRYEAQRGQLQNLVLGDPHDNVYRGVATDVSFATLQYMQRYQLLTVTNEHPSPVGVATTPARPLPPAYKNPSRILDITTLKQQPKLL